MNYIEYAKTFNANEETLYWIKYNLSNYLKENPENQDEIEHIIDYFIAKQPKRLHRMSYVEAKSNSEKWTKAQQKKGKHIKETEEDTEIVLDFKDGFKIVKLVSKVAYEREGYLMRHCFQGDTKVITFDGSFPIKDLSGKKVRILTRGGGAKIGTGSWREAEIKSFGKQQLWEIILEKNQGTNQEKKILTTDKHRWFVFNDIKNKQKLRLFEKTTDELSVGERFPYIHAKRIVFRSESKTKGISLSPIKEHCERNKKRSQSSELWKIKSIRKTQQKEEVYCAIVPKTKCFAIEDNILTGNCVLSYFGNKHEIFSLRDKDNMPHCTIDKNQAIRGKGNGENY